MKIKNIAISILFLGILLLTEAAFAFQFEDYRWGRSIAEIRSLVIKKGKVPLRIKEDRIIKYFDNILGEECTVTLEFTPSSKVLASIRIFFQDKSIGEDIKNLLAEKHGDFDQPNIFFKEYYWRGNSDYDSIILNYDYAGTTLLYFGGVFQEKYELEFQRLGEKEKQRF